MLGEKELEFIENGIIGVFRTQVPHLQWNFFAKIVNGLNYFHKKSFIVDV